MKGTSLLAVTLLLAAQVGNHSALAADEDPCAGEVTGNRQSYCDAAKASESAAKKNKTLATVYTGLAAVCTYACVASFFTVGAAGTVCTWSSVGTAVFDAVTTKQFMSGLTQLGTIALSKSLTKTDSSGAKGATQKTEGVDATGGVETDVGYDGGANAQKAETDWGACLQAAMAAVQAVQKNDAAKSEKDAAAANRLAAGRLISQARTGSIITPTKPGQFTSGDGARANSQQRPVGSLAETMERSNDVCAAGASGQFAAAVSCAVSSDSKLNGIVNNPEFANRLKEVTGLNPDDFLKKAAELGPSATMAAVSGQSFGADAGAKMAALMKDVEQSVHTSGAMYAGGGGARKPAGGGEEMSLDKMLGDIMAQFGPKKEGENAPGVNELLLGSAKRYPANVENDRFVSIFERVTSRYHRVYPRVWMQISQPQASQQQQPRF